MLSRYVSNNVRLSMLTLLTHTHTQMFVARLLPKWLIDRVAWQMMQYRRDRYLKKKAKKS